MKPITRITTRAARLDDQRQSAARLARYTEQLERQPQPITHDDSDPIRPMSALMAGFYRKAQNGGKRQR